LALDRSVLLLGDELALVESFVPALRRANFAVQRLIRPSGPIQLAEQAPRDLLVVVPPIANAERLFARTRAPGSPWRHTGVLLVADRSARATLEPALLRVANRIVSPAASSDEFLSEVSDLVEVAPRVAVHASIQLRLVRPEVETPSVKVANLSSTGMFLASDQPLPVGTVFGFSLDLPSEPEPLLGQAGVVRKATDPNGATGNGVRFLSLGGDGAARLDRLVQRQRERDLAGRGAAAAAAERRAAAGTGSSGVRPIPTAAALPQLKEELADLQQMIDELLQQGLARRLGSVDWYLTGMELGLDSLHSFSALLDAVHVGRSAGFETQNRIADLATVRRKLAEVALPQQDLRSRIRLMLELRPALERLRLELGAGAGGAASAAPRAPDAVAQILAEVRRLIGSRKSLATVRALIVDIGSARYLFAPGVQRRIAERVCEEYRAQATALGFPRPEQLGNRKGRKDALVALDRELRAYDQRLLAIHEKVYARKFQHLGTGNVEADLFDPKTLSVLIDTLAPGRDYLERAYSAYRHALELAGADPDLLQRAAALASTIRAAEREVSGAFRTGEREASGAFRTAEREPSGRFETGPPAARRGGT
jgi:hypothetical protein